MSPLGSEMPSLAAFPSLVAMFLARASERGDKPFLWAKSDGRWRSTSWREAAAQVVALAGALSRLGLESGDRVALVSENRPEWAIADLAIMAAGCVTVPAYTTSTERDHRHVLQDSGARAAIVSTQRLAGPLFAALEDGGDCSHVIAVEAIDAAPPGDVRIHGWQDLIDSEVPDVETFAKSLALTRDDLACLIYTSGTGGAPRGVMLHHGAILHNVAGAAEIFIEDFAADEEIFLSFLPLSHCYEHSGGLFLPVGLGAQIYYAEGLDKLASNIDEVRPTIMMAVPRLYEAFRQRILHAFEKQGRLPRLLLAQALAIGRRSAGGRPRLFDRPMDWLIERLVRPKIRSRFGGRIKAMVAGGAPLNPEVGLFFQSLGITVLQGYGQTEAAPIVSVNRPKSGIRMDSVGPPIRGTEVRIADDGEILVRGELVMKGYWRNPELTEATIRDGWLHTGDVGHLDPAGRLVITDRKKDIIVLDKGDNVAPQRVEGMLTLQPEILQAMVIGDRRPYLVAVLVPDPEWTTAWCAAQGKQAGAALHNDPAFHKALSAAVDRVNGSLSVIERVRRFIVADGPFTVENQQLTPSVKIRRHVLRQVYGERLDALYRS